MAFGFRGGGISSFLYEMIKLIEMIEMIEQVVMQDGRSYTRPKGWLLDR